MCGCIGWVDNFGICLMISMEGCDYFRKERLLVKNLCKSVNMLNAINVICYVS